MMAWKEAAGEGLKPQTVKEYGNGCLAQWGSTLGAFLWGFLCFPDLSGGMALFLQLVGQKHRICGYVCSRCEQLVSHTHLSSLRRQPALPLGICLSSNVHPRTCTGLHPQPRVGACGPDRRHSVYLVPLASRPPSLARGNHVT